MVTAEVDSLLGLTGLRARCQVSCGSQVLLPNPLVVGGIHSLCLQDWGLCFPASLRFFWMWTIFKVFIECYNIASILWVFGHEACGILVPPPEIELTHPLHWKLRVLSTRPPMKSPSTHGVWHGCLLSAKPAGAQLSTFSLVISQWIGKERQRAPSLHFGAHLCLSFFATVLQTNMFNALSQAAVGRLLCLCSNDFQSA